ncbi:MAG: hypothetical protein HUJ78_06105, partial [Mogibacterium sp.]|nr:hypothetical protein [Mogibacterium sp.]
MNDKDKEYAKIKIEELINRYENKTVPNSIAGLAEENEDMPIPWLNNFCINVYREKLTKHIKDKSNNSKEEYIKAKAELRNITEELLRRYSKRPAKTLPEVIRDNADLNISSIYSYTELIYNQTAKEYLIEKGIIKEKEKLVEAPERELPKIIKELWKKYPDGFSGYLTDLAGANPDIEVMKINPLTRKLYDMTTKQYLTMIGFLRELPFEEQEKKNLDNAIAVLQKKYTDNPLRNINDIDLHGTNISKLRFITLIKKYYNKDVVKFLRQNNILAAEEANSVKKIPQRDCTNSVASGNVCYLGVSGLEKTQQPKANPKSFVLFNNEEVQVDSWRDLYAKVFTILYDEYPELIPRDKSFVGGQNIDFGNAYASKSMTSPKRIFMHMYLETNYEADEIFSRISALFRLCGINESSLKIKTKDGVIGNLGESNETNVNLDASMDELIGIIDGIEYDGVINPLEVSCLREWLQNNKNIIINTEYSDFVKTVEDILEDDYIDENERDFLIKWANNYKERIDDIGRNINILIGILKGVVAANIIQNKEIFELDNWLKNNDGLSGILLFDKILNCISYDSFIIKYKKPKIKIRIKL